jgi:hypothetical protein
MRLYLALAGAVILAVVWAAAVWRVISAIVKAICE